MCSLPTGFHLGKFIPVYANATFYAASVATSPSPVSVAPPAYDTVVANPMTREVFMKTFVSSIDTLIGGMDNDAQIKSLRTAVINERGRVFDLVKKTNHLLGARIQDIRRRDMHILALQQQNRNLNCQMIALKRHYAMNPHASKINQWMQSGQVERIVLRPQGTINRVPATITRSNTRAPTRAARRVAPMVQRLGSQTVNGRRVAQRVNLEQEVADEQVNQARRAAQLLQQLRIETARLYQIEYCATILSDIEEYTGMEHMSNNIVAVLNNARINTLEVMKQFESLIQPFKDEWITIPRHTADQIDAICIELHTHSVDVYLVRKVARLARIAKKPSQEKPEVS
ncbi:hypothetical protein D6D01_06774 [Aureobasidium pullulans]|uniref:Uncharacterized protein n=1 Tax=Aureobasidium pullulans TaxID=5580 RepID=A0A4S9KWG0_AURPU|nr:hypothetical protein D6D01_06774 [Aureobasidium pullulans]